jgi:hypothetical protein
MTTIAAKKDLFSERMCEVATTPIFSSFAGKTGENEYS